MRAAYALLTRYAVAIYLAGAAALVLGAALLLWASGTAGDAAGSALAVTGLVAMGVTHDRAGA